MKQALTLLVNDDGSFAWSITPGTPLAVVATAYLQLGAWLQYTICQGRPPVVNIGEPSQEITTANADVLKILKTRNGDVQI